MSGATIAAVSTRVARLERTAVFTRECEPGSIAAEHDDGGKRLSWGLAKSTSVGESVR
jgi:hypothetical protein